MDIAIRGCRREFYIFLRTVVKHKINQKIAVRFFDTGFLPDNLINELYLCIPKHKRHGYEAKMMKMICLNGSDESTPDEEIPTVVENCDTTASGTINEIVARIFEIACENSKDASGLFVRIGALRKSTENIFPDHKIEIIPETNTINLWNKDGTCITSQKVAKKAFCA